MPIKVRIGDRLVRVGVKGETLHQVKDGVRQYLSTLEDDEIRLWWKETVGASWKAIGNEEQWVQAMETMQEQGRPVARIRMEWN
jgi:hypothetical protein